MNVQKLVTEMEEVSEYKSAESVALKRKDASLQGLIVGDAAGAVQAVHCRIEKTHSVGQFGMASACPPCRSCQDQLWQNTIAFWPVPLP